MSTARAAALLDMGNNFARECLKSQILAYRADIVAQTALVWPSCAGP